MIRLRRYRIFLFVTLAAILCLYYFNRAETWGPESPFGTDDLTDEVQDTMDDTGDDSAYSHTSFETGQSAAMPDEIDFMESKQTEAFDEHGKGRPDLPHVDVDDERPGESDDRPDQGEGKPDRPTSTTEEAHTATRTDRIVVGGQPTDNAVAAPEGGVDSAPEQSGAPEPSGAPKGDHGSGRFEALVSTPAVRQKVHWAKPTERHPVSSTIQLPTGLPKDIPKIQHSFAPESASQKKERELKLDAIRASFKRNWDGYRQFAWGHDELAPVSNSFKDTFNGWGATLVDALDTLWLMGMKEEFEEAVNKTKEIDFTISARTDIPVFETTIRYLGGLLGAYDVSGMKYQVLLDKAIELGEVLYGIFDTPNRMPMTFYIWNPEATAREHVAGGVVLAEIGTLAVEFTRLAQITKEPKWYDGIARITNALEELQNKTSLPGMWPVSLDASGCYSDAEIKASHEFGDVASPMESNLPSSVPGTPKPQDASDKEDSEGTQIYNNAQRTHHGQEDASGSDSSDDDDDDDDRQDGQGEELRHLKSDAEEEEDRTPLVKRQQTRGNDQAQCTGGLRASSYMDKYTLGGEADSAYEYFTKEYLLLGGLNDQYKRMYEGFMETINKYLLFRAMHKEEDRDVYFTGSFRPDQNAERTADGKIPGVFEAGNGHLACFVGGMVGLGAKTFNRLEELDVAEKLTDGCVWAYESTASGIMPEDFTPMVCERLDECAWNETKWYLELDPEGPNRDKSIPAESTGSGITIKEDKEMSDPMGDDDDDEGEEGDDEEDVSKEQPGEPIDPERTSTKLTVPKDGNAMPGAPPVVPDVKLEDLEPRDLRARQLDPLPSESSAAADAQTTNEGADDEADAPTVAELQDKLDLFHKKGTKKPAPIRMSISQHTEPGSEPEVDADAEPNTIPDPDVPRRPTRLTPSATRVSQEQKPLTHKQFVEERIKNERLFPGAASINGRRYLLRPEAIESVFYMYRITGHEYWRRKGWKMFRAIEYATKTEAGSSAIWDVTIETTQPNDQMESYWLAETLKYFYLLFSDPQVGSLDDYVFNTEAHLLLRPDAINRM